MRCSHLQKALFRSSPSMTFLQEACLWLAEGNYIRLNWVIHMGKCPALCSPFLWLLLHITQLMVQTTQVYYLLVWSEKSKIGLTGLQGVGWAVFLPEAPGEDLFLPFSTSGGYPCSLAVALLCRHSCSHMVNLCFCQHAQSSSGTLALLLL